MKPGRLQMIIARGAPLLDKVNERLAASKTSTLDYHTESLRTMESLLTRALQGAPQQLEHDWNGRKRAAEKYSYAEQGGGLKDPSADAPGS